MSEDSPIVDRRSFLRGVASAAAVAIQPVAISTAAQSHPSESLDGYTLIATLDHNSTEWKVYEDLRTRDGALAFISPKRSRVLTKSADATFAEANPPYLGLDIKDI